MIQAANLGRRKRVFMDRDYRTLIRLRTSSILHKMAPGVGEEFCRRGILDIYDLLCVN